MKLYISSDTTKQLQDYVMLSPCQNTPLFKKIEFENLEKLVCDAQATEIILDHALCYAPATKLYDILTLIVKKMHHGAQLIVCDLDVEEILRLYSEYKITLGELNVSLYGYEYPKRSVFSQKTIVEILKELGLKIMKRRYNEIEFVVEAKRQ